MNPLGTPLRKHLDDEVVGVHQILFNNLQPPIYVHISERLYWHLERRLYGRIREKLLDEAWKL